jgi:hypothetical protein
VREDALLSWAEQLFTVLDAFRPAGLRDAVAQHLTDEQAPRSPDAMKQVQGRLERITDLYAMGHWTRDRYLEERGRLEALLAELSEELQSTTEPALPLGGLVEGWRTNDPRTRHDLLAAFFDELDVLDGEIVAVAPRADRAAEAMALLEKAYEQYCPGSPGGIRTRDLSLERAAS